MNHSGVDNRHPVGESDEIPRLQRERCQCEVVRISLAPTWSKPGRWQPELEGDLISAPAALLQLDVCSRVRFHLRWSSSWRYRRRWSEPRSPSSSFWNSLSDMGLGKTVQMIALMLASKPSESDNNRTTKLCRSSSTLIVCPSAIISQVCFLPFLMNGFNCFFLVEPGNRTSYASEFIAGSCSSWKEKSLKRCRVTEQIRRCHHDIWGKNEFLTKNTSHTYAGS